jgi:DNA-binding CsgD family transcriptional regulator/PAS domain-containing protein
VGYDREPILRLIGLIYDASLNPALWPRFLEALGELIGGHAVNLGYVDEKAPMLSVTSAARWDPAAMRDYGEYFAQCDPWATAGVRLGLFVPGAIGVGEEVILKSELHRTEFYNDYGRKHAFVGGLGAIILRDGHSLAMLSASHLPNREFGSAQIELFRILLPHLERALQLHRRLTRIDADRDAIAEVFQRLPLGVILLDELRGVTLVNEAAAEITNTSDGLLLTRHGLAASVAAEGATLRALILAAVATTNGKGLHAGGAMSLSRPSGKRPLSLLVTPLRSSNTYAPRGRAGAALFVTDPERSQPSDVESLRHLHGLTRAEARIAMLLTSGLSFADVIEMLGITANTGRGHLKNIFSKTETRTQAQLVRLLLSIPVVRPPA